MTIYRAYVVLDTLLYRSEPRTLYCYQEHRLNIFHMHCLRRILGITWHDYGPNKFILAQVGIPSMFALFTQRCLHWLSHVSCMEYGCIPKDMLYGKLAIGSTHAGRPLLCYKDMCKCDVKAGVIDPARWKAVAGDRGRWKEAIWKS